MREADSLNTMGPKAAVITDSTWSLPGELRDLLRIEVLPLHVSAGGRSVLDLPENAAQILGLLSGPKPASTSQPNPAEVETVLRAVVDRGANAILCIHLSAALSGTWATVAAAARRVEADSGVPLTVLDSGTVGGGLGYAVAVAAAALAGGATLEQATEQARECAATATVQLSVADLGHLQRGGRLRMGQAALGAALGISPVLEVVEGELRVLESVRGARRAHQALLRKALAAAGAPPRAGAGPVSFAVHHARAPERAARMAADLRAGAAVAGIAVDRLDITAMSGVLAVHAGPGALAVVTAHTRGLLHSA